MKQLSLYILCSLLFLVSCVSEKSKSKSTTTTDALCYQGSNYYTMPGCPGHSGNTGVTTGGTTGTSCYGNAYYQTQGCPGFCAYYPSHASCSGSTTGGTTGSTSNPYPNYPSSGVTPNWGMKYPGGLPSGSCSPSYAPTGISYAPYETRKATMTIVGKTWYNPSDSVASSYMNTSSLLRSVNGSKQLFETDALLKVRFKALPQPESSSASPYCYGRQTGSSIAGYTKLSFNVQLMGTKANGQVQYEPLGTFTIGVNSCTPAIDLSSYASMYPGGIYLIVQSVKGNQAYFPADYDYKGFTNVDSFSDIRSQDCWVLDVEVAADGTKTFD